MNTVITIGREFGSGGHQIGVELSKRLNIPFYDKELLERAAKDSGYAKDLFVSQDEKPTGSFLFSLVMDSYSSTRYGANVLSDMPLNQKVFLAQFETIKNIANQGPCILIGRCADYALEFDDRLLSVFLRANIETRIRRISALYELSNARARDKITKADKERASYYNYYTNKKWGSAQSYNLVIDTGLFGIDGTVDLIMKAIEEKERPEKHHIYEQPMYSSINK
jgi:cytidylate kinase